MISIIYIKKTNLIYKKKHVSIKREGAVKKL